MKKIASLVGAGALLLGLAGSAFAGYGGGGYQMMYDNYAMVGNSAYAYSNTGWNGQGGDGADMTMRTGDAWSSATAVTVANTHIGCSWCGRGYGGGDFAMVGNDAQAVSDTGFNGQYGGEDGGDDMCGYRGCHHYGGGGDDGAEWVMRTGNAGSEANAWTVVNTHLNFGGMSW